MFIHFFGHEIKPFNLWYKFNKLFLKLYFLFLYEDIFDLFCIFGALIDLELIFCYYVGIMAHNCLDLKLFFYLLLLLFYLYLHQLGLQLGLHLYCLHFLLELLNLLLFQLQNLFCCLQLLLLNLGTFFNLFSLIYYLFNLLFYIFLFALQTQRFFLFSLEFIK